MEFKNPSCFKVIESHIYDSGVHLLNTSVIPPGADGEWVIERCDLRFINHCLLHLASQGDMGFLHSHVGHQATADIWTELLQQKVEMDRTPWDGSGIGFALQLFGRPKEGEILDTVQMMARGFTLRVLVRKTSFPA